MSFPRISHERLLLDRLKAVIDPGPRAQVFDGSTAVNRFAVNGWGLLPRQQFQFGDLRIETEHVTVIVEIESAGGATNLVKYWPLLASGKLKKRLVIVHVFRIWTARGDARPVADVADSVIPSPVPP